MIQLHFCYSSSFDLLELTGHEHFFEHSYSASYRTTPEKVAFLGVEKHSIVAIGTYGCSQTRDDKYHLKAGLEAMLETLEPVVVLVYGSMNKSVFSDYLHATKFVHYPDWTTNAHKGGDR